MATDFQRGIKIYLDAPDTSRGIEEIRRSTERLRKEYEQLALDSDKNAKKMQKLSTQIERNEATEKRYKDQLEETKRILNNLSGATYNELFAVRNRIRNQLRTMAPGTEEYNATLMMLNKTETQLLAAEREMKKEVGSQPNIFARAAQAVNRYAGLVMVTKQILQSVITKMRQYTDSYAEIEEAQANVRKYTGLTKNEIADLNKELKKMDTRTGRKALNDLASDAGRLGIKSKEMLLDFVDAGDKIRMALGEDLGEDSVKNIAKLTMMFGEDDTKGLRGAMLATGSAINEVAQNSTAAEGYLVDFLARTGSAAMKAKITQDQLMGYASVLDQNMQREEMAATAFSNLMTKMYQTPLKFAQLANIEVKSFTRLLKEDANQALLAFLDAMNQKDGFAEMAPLFKEMGLDGQRAIGVIATMAGKIDDIRVAQELANKAYTEGVSVTNEAEIRNNTVQAQIEKAKKTFEELSIEIGEKLYPILKDGIHYSSDIVKALIKIIDFTAKHIKIIAGTGNVLLTYIAIQKTANIVYGIGNGLKKLATTMSLLHTAAIAKENGNIAAGNRLLSIHNGMLIKNKLVLGLCTAAAHLFNGVQMLLNGNIVAAGRAFKALWATIAANPVGAIATAISTVVFLLIRLAKKTDLADEAMADFNKRNLEAQNELKKTYNALVNAGDGTENRRLLIEEFNTKYGGYLTNLLTEKSTLDEITTAYEQVQIAMQKKLAQQVLSEATEKIEREGLEDKSKALLKVQNVLSKVLTDGQLSHILPKIISQVDDLVKAGEDYYSVSKTVSEGISDLFPDGYTDSFSNFKTFLTGYTKEVSKTANAVDKLKKRLYPYLGSEEVPTTNQDKTENPDGTGGDKGNKPKKEVYIMDEDKYKVALKQQENYYNQRMLKLQQAKQKENLTEEEYALLSLSDERAHQKKLMAINNTYLQFETDAEKREDSIKNRNQSAQKLLDLDEKEDKLRLDSLKRCHAESLDEWDTYYNEQRLQKEQALNEGTLKQTEYDLSIQQLEMEQNASRLAVEREYYRQLQQLVLHNESAKKENLENSYNAILKLESDAMKQRMDLQKSLQGFYTKYGKTNVTESVKTELAALELAYRNAKAQCELYGVDTKKLTEIYETAKTDLIQKGQDKRNKVLEKYGLTGVKTQYQIELEELDAYHRQGLLSEKEYQKALNKLKVSHTMETWNQMNNYAADAVGAIQDAETAKVEAKYDVLIKAAEGNNEEQERLETEKQEKMLEVEKKYADVQFAIKCSQIVASTAVAAMKAWELGPVAGPIAAALVAVTGVAQLAAATSERNRVKSMSMGGSSSGGTSVGERSEMVVQYASGRYDVIGEDDGHTYRNVPYIGSPTGVVQNTALISEHGAELVVNAEDLRRLQKHVNYGLVVDAINDAREGRVPQRAKGSYDSIDGKQPLSTGGNSQAQLVMLLNEVVGLLSAKSQLPVKAYVLLSEINKAQELKEKSENIFTKGDKNHGTKN